MKKTIFILTAALAVVAALGLTAFSYASARGLDATTAGFQHRGFGPGPGGDHPLAPYVEAAIAEILGISVEEFQAAREEGTRLPELIEAAGLTAEEFQAALETAMPDVLAEAVADEVITQDEADAILERGLRPFGRVHRGFGPLGPYLKEASAEILGLSVEELDAAKAEGTSMTELLEEAGLSGEEFQAEMEASLPDIVEAALEDGAIDQDQADLILENGLDGLRCRGGFGRHGGRGFGGRGFGPAPQDAPAVNG